MEGNAIEMQAGLKEDSFDFTKNRKGVGKWAEAPSLRSNHNQEKYEKSNILTTTDILIRMQNTTHSSSDFRFTGHGLQSRIVSGRKWTKTKALEMEP